jgi:undecaprenyl-phosphate 4-deoxy-4-formamido-L-arabinose transferase
MQKAKYDIVIPVFNSSQSLQELFQRISKVFAELSLDYRVIFVEDCGTDNSWQVISQLKKEYPEQIIAIKLAKNFGQHNAILCGMKFSSAEYLITIDDDLQTPPEEIPKLIHTMQESQADLVYGHYSRKKHSIVRNIGSRVVKAVSRKVSHAPGEGSSFKLMTRELADKILTHHQNFVYIDELLLWYTDSIEFVEVAHHKRKGSKSGYNTFKLFNLATNLVIYYTAIPLRMMVIGGVAGSILSLLFALFRIYKKMYFKVPMGYTSIIVTILFSTSIILLSLGIIGEYLNRMYKIQNKKPPYSIKKVHK